MSDAALWERFQKYYAQFDAVNVSLDISRMKFSDDFFASKQAELKYAYAQMRSLEAGGIANPDENRMVGHYWLRDSSRAPSAELKTAIDTCLSNIKKFAKGVHDGKIKPQKAKLFKNILIVGIGGSALGPQFVGKALGTARDKMTPYFFDNTDPDGMDAVLQRIGDGIKETLTIVISKSGGTKETRNGMLEAKRAYKAAGLAFEKHAVAVTQTDAKSELYQFAWEPAPKGKWLDCFPMWDWVGGRTSELSAVGLLPAALQGLNIQGMLDGARAMDEITRPPADGASDALKNPAATLALMWLYATNGRGEKDMVILPYKDRLELFSKYLQQLVMESLGKGREINGRLVNQGIAVYGNKGSTDQHAYVQQLREGVNNFFATFIEVLKDRGGRSMKFEGEGVTSGDYLNGFYQGTRRALYENDRESITITVPDAGAQTIGKLIALYERAVGYYANFVGINAYHQPGVEAGKKAATAVVEMQQKILVFLGEKKGSTQKLNAVAKGIGTNDAEAVFKILEHLSANPDHGVKRTGGASAFDASYGVA